MHAAGYPSSRVLSSLAANALTIFGMRPTAAPTLRESKRAAARRGQHANAICHDITWPQGVVRGGCPRYHRATRATPTKHEFSVLYVGGLFHIAVSKPGDVRSRPMFWHICEGLRIFSRRVRSAVVLLARTLKRYSPRCEDNASYLHTNVASEIMGTDESHNFRINRLTCETRQPQHLPLHCRWHGPSGSLSCRVRA
eukprot:scaffold67560_cov31-Tisochrysis_lutea.AAC.2